jgi:hypothetical protein
MRVLRCDDWGHAFPARAKLTRFGDVQASFRFARFLDGDEFLGQFGGSRRIGHSARRGRSLTGLGSSYDPRAAFKSGRNRCVEFAARLFRAEWQK